MKRSAAFLVLVLAVLTMTGARRKEPPAPTSVKLVAKLPTFAALAESNPTQEKGGLRISIAPVAYKVEKALSYSDHRASASFKEALLGPDLKANHLVERMFTPSATISPDKLRFSVHVSNQMSHVFRGAGIVVQFNVAGKLVSPEPSGYAELVNMVLPPRSEQILEIYGPPIDTIPDKTTVSIFLYDVVTNSDAAGNVTEKQNFEWYFQYVTQDTELEVEVPPPQRVWVRGP